MTVPVGGTVGGTFAHIHACTDVTHPGCVIAYSNFDQTPPSDSIFGRVSSPINLLSDQHPTGGLQVLCTNPVAGADAGAGGELAPYFPTAAFPDSEVPSFWQESEGAAATPWVTYLRLHQARCESQAGAHLAAGRRHRRPRRRQAHRPTNPRPDLGAPSGGRQHRLGEPGQ